MWFAGPRWKCERCARGQNPGTATTAEPPIKLCQRHTRHREGRLQSPLPLTFLIFFDGEREVANRAGGGGPVHCSKGPTFTSAKMYPIERPQLPSAARTAESCHRIRCDARFSRPGDRRSPVFPVLLRSEGQVGMVLQVLPQGLTQLPNLLLRRVHLSSSLDLSAQCHGDLRVSGQAAPACEVLPCALFRLRASPSERLLCRALGFCQNFADCLI